ncbi:MAG: site-2 protease family protein [Myxococcales bacterium]|nr:site-2 protease family protein [Myxococcales bacterium]
MRWSWKLGRFAGIDTYVHASFLLLVGWAAWAAWSGAGTMLAVLLGVGFLLAVFGSVLLHELGHALVARHYGIATRRIVLSPIGGIAQLEGMPREPRQELAVALAGPAVNFGLAAALWILAPAFGLGLLGSLASSLIVANLTLGLFNLIPAFPMDGGRALRAFLAARVGAWQATQTAAKVGKVVALVMGLYGLVAGPFMLVLIAGFVWFAANAELAASRYHASAYDEVEVLGPPPAHRVWRRDIWRRDPYATVGRTRRHPADPRGWGPLRNDGPRMDGPVRVVVIRRGWF